VQPARQLKSLGSQIGAAVPHSAFDRHSTHLPSLTRQSGALRGQSPFVVHWTHCWVAASQIFAPIGQSLVEAQPMQSPVAVWQIAALRGHIVLLVHAGWHWWSETQHAGAAALQSPFDRQVTHAPWRQWGAAAGQLAFAVQSTQPSTGSHSCCEPHWLMPLPPHRALPPNEFVVPLELQASKTQTIATGHASETGRNVMRSHVTTIEPREGPGGRIRDGSRLDAESPPSGQPSDQPLAEMLPCACTNDLLCLWVPPGDDSV
jgi:hypothetical protein